MYFLSDGFDLNSVFLDGEKPPENIDALTEDQLFALAKSSVSLKKIMNKDMSLPYLLDMIYYNYRDDAGSPLMTATQITPEFMLYYTQNAAETKLFLSTIQMHRHNYYEFLYVIDGEVCQNIEGTRHLYPKGSCCIMNKNVHHKEEYSDYCRIVFVKISEDLIRYILSCPVFWTSEAPESFRRLYTFFIQERSAEAAGAKEYMDFIPTESCRAQHQIYDYLEQMARLLQERNPASGFTVVSLLASVFSCLCREADYVNAPVSLGTEAQRVLFDAITESIKEKQGCVSRRELEEAFHYSGDYIYRIIEKYAGLSISQYCMDIRMQNAADLLAHTKRPVQEICTDLSFKNTTQFYAAFKARYGTTPRKYRSK